MTMQGASVRSQVFPSALWACRTTQGSAETSLYLGAHDPKGRLKMMPAAAALPGNKVQGALLRVVHIPDSQTDGRAKNWTVPYDTVMPR